ncbi:addiction module antidote protein, HigA family [Sphingobium terrigena]|uniref:Addiction module antidote protein, HigA family n=1 Tax=Sphingobium terrigena TaxID=2304063 RepID=A0A418YQP5_9SPHN|nr:HigA family addiction module antitoxin [Sphingobium terrigena]RJG53801.1 addiction module antidote protein, HigA family [Sphingobium terrigena]
MALKMHASLAVHPGDWLKTEMVEAHGLKIGDLADHLGVTRQTVSRLLNQRQDLTADMAIRFEKLFGIDADTLMRMQIRHDLAVARGHADELSVKPLAA